MYQNLNLQQQISLLVPVLIAINQVDMIHIDVPVLLLVIAMKAATVEDMTKVAVDGMTIAEEAKIVAEETIAEDAKMVAEETIAEDAKTVTEETIAEDVKIVAEETIAEESKIVREEEMINMPNEAIMPTKMMIKDANPEGDQDLPTKMTVIDIILPLGTVIALPDIVPLDIKAVKERKLERKVVIGATETETEIETETTEKDVNEDGLNEIKGYVCIPPKCFCSLMNKQKSCTYKKSLSLE